MVQDQDGDGGDLCDVPDGHERVRGPRADWKVRAVDGWGGAGSRCGDGGGGDGTEG